MLSNLISRRRQRDARIAEKALSKTRLYEPSAFTSAIASWELGFIVSRHVDEFARFALDRQRVPRHTNRALALGHFARTLIRDSYMNVQWELDRWAKTRDIVAGEARTLRLDKPQMPLESFDVSN